MNPSPSLPRELPAAGVAAVAGARSWPRLLLDTVLVILGFPCYGILALVVMALCASAGRISGASRSRRVCQRIVHQGVAIWAAIMEGVGIYRVDFDPATIAALRSLRGTIIAPNHPSLLDATLFLARMPELTCLMKRAVLDNPFMGYSARLAGYLRNDYGPDFIRQGRDALRSGENLLIFPEGTRTVDGAVNPFKKGFALMAALADAPVQTVFIEMPVLYLGKRWPLTRVPLLPVHIKVRVGQQFCPQAGQTAKAFGAEVERYFQAELECDGEGVRRKAG